VFFALICDGVPYFQVNDSLKKEFQELEPPYPGGKLAGKITPDILENQEELLRLAKLSYQYKRNK
jgi:TfoX/Sxy family transcriptional regulator of competence genes